MKLSSFQENLYNGLREFSDHPINHTVTATKQFVKDYWDLGAMALAGFAFNDYHNEIFGEARFPIVLIGGLTGLIGAGEDMDRIYRNVCAGFATFCGFWGRGTEAPLSAEIGNYGVATFWAAGSLYHDRERRRSQPSSENSQPIEQPLEILVE